MTLTKMQAMLGVATIILTITSVIGGAVASLESHFAALDTRLGKLESAIKTLNATTPDDRYKQLVKELIAEERLADTPKKGATVHVYGIKGIADCTKILNGCTYTDAGAAADAPAVKVPQ